MAALRTCSKCGHELSATLEYFYAHSDGRLRGDCKDCVRARSRAWHYAHLDKAHERSAAWQAAHREEVRVAATAWYAENRARGRARRAAYYAANPERNAARRIAWQRANPDKVAASSQRHRARQFSALGTHTADDITAIYETQDGLCAYCGYELGTDYHTDHKLPLSRGGSDWPENLAIACPSCNLSKGDKLLSEWFATRESQKETA